jgi:hypothetical protein
MTTEWTLKPVSHHHDGKPCDGAVWEPEPRCTVTGHRIETGTRVPVQTRELPARFWLFELAARVEARLRLRYLGRGDGDVARGVM